MSRLVTMMRNPFSRRTFHTSSLVIPRLSITRKAQREPASRYERGGYHPVFVGDTYNSRYTVLRQLGWGVYSTVWLVRDTRNGNLASMKMLVADLTSNAPPAIDELAVLKTLQSRNPLSPGYPHICHLLDDFVHQGPNGDHRCLILEAMPFNMLEIYNAFRALDDPMPLFLVQRLARQVLLALQYMHDECGLVHTDLKADNILMSGADEQLELFGKPNVKMDMTELGFSTYKLSDFGSASKVSNKFAGLIQPTALRSPEVIIGAEWDTKADIWNFACLIFEFCSNTTLFNPTWNIEQSGLARPQTHLAQIVSLCGPFPRSFLDKGNSKLTSRYFDTEGHLLKGSLSYSIRLEDLLAGKQLAEEIPLCVDFLSKGLIIDPSQRWSATQLLAHPWMDGVE